MQLSIIVVVVIVGILILSDVLEKKKGVKRDRAWLKSHYGKRPDYDGNYEVDGDIGIYHNLVEKQMPEDERIDHITWNDLEMNKVFSRVNSTRSFAGEQVLFSELHRLNKDKKNLKRRGKTAEFYSTHEEEREEAQLLLGKLKKDRVNYYIPTYIELLEAQRIPFLKVCKLLLCSLIFLSVGAFITMNPLFIGAAVVNFLANIVLYAVGKTKYESFMESLYGIVQVVKTAKVLVLNSDSEGEKEAIKKLDRVSKNIGTLERKKQASVAGDIVGLVSDYLLGALMWDFIVYDKVIHQLMGKQKEFMELYRFVGEVDMCIGIASFRKSLPGYCIPQFDETQLILEELYHPLVEEPITNNLKMKRNIILTGSNASGKSTFMKAVAVNIILGQSLYTCTGRRVVIPNAGVITSMAVKDDIATGDSYYMKEIKYLKRMIDGCRNSRMMFCGIDEILRGTNTPERVAASVAILEYLCERNCLIMVASHDLELAKMLEKTYDNYYFCEQLQEQDILFDYKLRKGISNSHNAIRLLQQVGFPKEIIEKAGARYEEG